MRGVLSVVLNDEEMEWGGPGADDKGAEMLVVVVRRKGLGIYKLGSRMVNIKVSKELHLPLHIGNSLASRPNIPCVVLHLSLRCNTAKSWITQFSAQLLHH